MADNLQDMQPVNMAQQAMDKLLEDDGDEIEESIVNEPHQEIVVGRVLNGIRACSPFLTKAVKMDVADVIGEIDKMLNATRQLFNLVAKECAEQKVEVKDEQWGVVNALCIDFVAENWSSIAFDQPLWATLLVKLLSEPHLFVYRNLVSGHTADSEALSIDIGVTGSLLQALAPCIDIHQQGEAILQQMVITVRNTVEKCVKRLAKFHVAEDQEELIRIEIIKQSDQLLSAIIVIEKMEHDRSMLVNGSETTMKFDVVIKRFETFIHVLTESIFINSRMVK